MKLNISFLCIILFLRCKNVEKSVEQKNTSEVLIDEDLKWWERMMLSEIERFPEAWQLDFHERPVWSYPNGLVLKTSEELYNRTGKKVYHDYILSNTDALIDSTGSILTYKPETKKNWIC